MSTTRSLPRFSRGVPFLLFAAALAAGGATAHAEAPVPMAAAPTEPTALAADVAGLETGDLDESSYDIPGKLIVDARDDLDDGGITALARDFGLRFLPTALEAETRLRLGAVRRAARRTASARGCDTATGAASATGPGRGRRARLASRAACARLARREILFCHAQANFEIGSTVS